MATLPNPNPLTNNAVANYQFYVDPSATIPTSSGNISNDVSTFINVADPLLVKSVNNFYGDIGDVLTYTVVITNAGNMTADNIVLTDTTPNGTTFVQDSIQLNSMPKPGEIIDPPTGFLVGNLSPNAVATVTWDVLVDFVPSPNPIPNSATNTFDFVVDPIVPTTISGARNSNIVNTQINTADISGSNLLKSANPTFGKVGDVITYTIVMKNSGNTTANNVVFTDTIPTNTTFVSNSVTVNGTTVPGGDPTPPTGVTLPNINPGAISTLTFKVTISALSTNPIYNQGKVAYTYTVTPSLPNGANKANLTNDVNIFTNQAVIDYNIGGGMIKAVDLPYAKVGDTLTYTITLGNTGNVTANNVIFTDTIPNGTTFVTDSVTVDGGNRPGESPAPPTGLTIGSIGPGSASTVVFMVTVNTIPTINPIPNNSTVRFNYTVDPSVPDGVTSAGNSNQSTTQINQAVIDNAIGGGLTKSVDKPYSKVGDTLTYTIRIKNTGNVTATNVIFTDTIPTDTTFVNDSVTLNGTVQTGVSPDPSTPGVPVGSVGPSAVSTVVFKVTVNTIPCPNPIPNNGTVNFTYTVNPDDIDAASGSGNTNQVTTQINQAIIDNTNGGGMVKDVDKTFGKVGDILTYTISLKNTGNVTANNVVFTDTIPSGTSFVTNSVTLNGSIQTGVNPDPSTPGVPVGSIGPSAISTVVFKVTVNTIPSPNPIPNNGTVNFTYTIHPDVPNSGNGSGNSNQVTTQINQAVIDNTIGGGMIKTVDKNYVDVGDTITYTITLKNTGNTAANSVVFTDTIPSGTTFVTDSLTLDGIIQPGASPAPPTGIPVGTIGAGSAATIVFKVTVNTIPSPNPIPNNSTVRFNYTIDPGIPDGGSGGGNSNGVTTKVNNATFFNGFGGFIKSVDKSSAKIGDILNYTLALRNKGNVTANNIMFTDTIPNGTTFIPNSLRINGLVQPGADPTPPLGVTIPNIAPSGVSTITFQVSVSAIPVPNPIPNQGKVAYTYTVDPSTPNGKSGEDISNTSYTTVGQATIDYVNGGGMVKAVDLSYAKVGDTLTYTIGLTNTGNVTAANVIFTDTIPSGTTFVTNSLTLNGTVQIGASPAPPAGINVGVIGPSQTTTVEFKVTVNTIPTLNPVPNNSTVRFNYTVDPSVPNGGSGSGNSNQVTTQVNQAVIDNSIGGGLVKSVDKAYGLVGDTLTYTIRIRNTGNVTATNVVFTDTIPTDTTFVTDSVTLNGSVQTGVSPDPSTPGVTVGTVGPSSVSTVVFKVTVNTIPCPNPIPNNGTVNFSYTLDPLIPDGASGSGNTNQVTTQINQAIIDNTMGGGMVKAVDKTFSKVGDILTYTITLKNTGNVAANNVILTDTIPGGTNFVTNSLTLNGTVQIGANPAPPAGFTVGSIGPSGVSTVVFKVLVNTIPTINPIPNNATVRYNFTLTPSVPNGASGSGNSNQVTTQVNQAVIDNTVGGGMIKTVDIAYGDVGDTLTYTITLKNTGNTAANNVVFTDTIPSGTSFVTDSVTLDGIPQFGANPDPIASGVAVGTIGAGSASTIIFKVTVNTIPSPNPVPNNSTVRFNYTIDPGIPDGASGSGNSNQVTTKINRATFFSGLGGFVKSVDKSSGKLGDILNYTLALRNKGNVTANNIMLTDTIPNGTTFIPNSLRINGIVQPGATPAPPLGVTIPNIAPSGVSTITFQVSVSAIPVPNPIPNQGKVAYTYTVDPSTPNGKSGEDISNTSYTAIGQATIDFVNGGGMVKAVDLSYAKVGDTLTYTIGLTNTGNVTAANVIFTDTIPSGTSLVSGSVFVNSINQPGATPAPPSGINVGIIGPSQTTTVEFKVTVNTIPTLNPVPNNSTVRFNYTVDPSVPNGASGSGNSNQVTTQVNQAVIDNTVGAGLIKAVNPKFGKVTDIILYTITLRNTGNVTADNVIFLDTIPNNTTFITNSLALNGINQLGADPSPPGGFNIGSIGPGRASTVTFSVIVDTIPTPNPIPNTATALFNFTVDPAFPDGASASGNTNLVATQINDAIINNATGGLVKSVDKAFGSIGDILTYTINIANTGNTSANNVVFKDTIPSGTSFITNSVTINGAVQIGANPNPPTGVALGTIGPGGNLTLQFKVTVTTIPTPNPIPNSGNITFTFTINPSVPNGASGSGNSNIVTTQINQAIIDNLMGGGLVKSVDKAFADMGDILTYTVSMRNTGNTPADNIVFTDTIPNGTTFVPDSVTLDGINLGPVNPQTGINVGTINPGQTSTLVFMVSVITIPTPNPVRNSATVKFDYTEDPAVPDGKSSSGNSNIVSSKVNSGNFALSPIGIIKSADKYFARVGDIITYAIGLRNTGNSTDNNIVFTDTIPNGTTFLTNSVTINGAVQPGASPMPPGGVPVGSITPGGVSTIAFKVMVITIPTSNPIPNEGKVVYTYTVDPALPNGRSAANLTNTTLTQVNDAVIDYTIGGGLVKTADKAFGKVGDTITYTIGMTNTGNVDANNVVFTDTIPNGTSLVLNSVMLNGVPQMGASPAPPAGISVGTIAPGTTSTVEFMVTVNTIPSPNPIPNNGTVRFTFTVNPSIPNGAAGGGNTNRVTTQINTAIIDYNGVNGNGLSKSVNSAFATVGDTLNYVIRIKNTGNVTANNVIFTDTIPTGTTFVNNSFAVNGIPQIGANPSPPGGVNLGSINPNQVLTISFKALVVSVPTPNTLPNSSTVNFTYTMDPAIPDGQSSGGNSNTVSTEVNGGFDPINGGFVKSVNKSFAKVNDTLIYDLVINNNGNSTLANILIKDTIPNGASFIPNSVSIDGVPKPGFNPSLGISISQLAIGATTTIEFNVKVSATIPSPNPISNNGVMTYTYTVDPSVPNGKTGSAITNNATTQINSAILNNASGGLVKLVDKNFADVGDILVYTANLLNTGNVLANNILITDTIPNGTTFIPNSVFVNGAPLPGVDPLTGIPVLPIAPGASASVTFLVTVDTLPSPNPIPNNLLASYIYTIDPITPIDGSDTNISNTVTTKINNANFNGISGVNGVNKIVDKPYAKVGDILTYTIGLLNTGNVSANNVVFYDTIPVGTTYNTGSFMLNGITQPGANPQAGVSLGFLAPNITSTVVFKVTVNTLPTINPIPNSSVLRFTYTVNPSIPNGKSGGALSNEVTTQINQAIIDYNIGGGFVKAADTAYAKVGDIINYTITLGNTGNADANNVIFTDTIPPGTAFVTNSVTLDGIPQPGTSPAPPTGITVPTIAAQSAAIITFQVTVVSIPVPNPTPNRGTVRFSFTVNPSIPNGGSGSGNSNTITTQINTANIGGNGLVKTTTPATAAVGDTLTYTITAKNIGNVTATNISITDTIPNGTTFVTNSVTVNGAPVAANPETGIPVGTLAPNQVSTITFKVTVGQTIPSPNPIPNGAMSSFNFTVDPSIPNGATGNGLSNISLGTINSAIINNVPGGGLVKVVDKSYVSTKEVLTYTITIGNTGNVTANNVILRDTIPTGTTFITNSVTVNGVVQPAVNPQNGVSVGNIGPSALVTLAFKVQIISTIPSPNPILNDSRVEFTYTVIPTLPNGRIGGGISNQVNTQVNAAIIDTANNGFMKSADKAYADVDDVITYTLTLINTGNVLASNVVVTDTIPNGTTFVTDSVTLDGIPQGGAVIAPPTGFTVPLLNPNQTATITFKVTIATLPTPNPIPNSATVNFLYTKDPSIPNGAAGTGNSNIIKTQVNTGGLNPAKGGFTKTPDKDFAKVGDIITYTSALKNIGIVTITNIMFYDTIPNGTALVSNSVTLNGVIQPGANPQTGVSVGNLGPAAVSTVIFKIVVNTLPTPNPIVNTAYATYNYTVDPSVPNGATGSDPSTASSTQINQAIIDYNNGNGLVKSVDKSYAILGDILNYLFTISNTGNTTANNVVLTDTVPNGTVYVNNSALVNGMPVTIVNPQSGIPIGSVPPNEVVTATFKVMVSTIPSPNPIPNSGTVNYTFVVNPVTIATAPGSGNSNIVNTQINQAIIDNTLGGGFVKSVNKAYADINDIISYTIRVKNTGNVTANNILFTDTIPNGTNFIPNSVTINGIPQLGTDPMIGIPLGSLGPAVTATVMFNVTVITIPSPNPIPNSGTVNYTYTLEPRIPNGAAGSGNTNIVYTQVNTASFDPASGGIIKSVNKDYAKVGDTLIYTIALRNTGNTTANNVIFVDTIPNGTAFVNNSLSINSIIQPGSNPQSGVSLSSLPPGITNTIQFRVIVTTVPTINPIPNRGNVIYSYVVDPSMPSGKRDSDLSNIVTTQINDPFINPGNGGLIKTVDKQFATIGDTLLYTVGIRNVGNAVATFVLLKDTIPKGTTFILNSVTIDGIPQPSVNPQSGINLPQLFPGQNTTVTFNVAVVTLPTLNPVPNNAVLSYKFTVEPSIPDGASSSVLSNVVLTQINAALIDYNNGGGLNKSVDYNYADVGYILTYTIRAKNTGNVTANAVVIADTIPEGTSLVQNSVTLNGVPQPGANPQAGISLGSLGPSLVSTIGFKVVVNSIPSVNPIPNNALSTYSFIVNPNAPTPTIFNGGSNTVFTQVNNGTIDYTNGGGFLKAVSSNVSKVGDTLIFTLSLKNTGNVTVNNVIVTDTVPNGSTFIPGSATVNGLPVTIINPSAGIPVGTIGPNQTSTVVFNVLVTNVPIPNPMVNSATTRYTYTVDPSVPDGTSGSGNSNSVYISFNEAIIDVGAGGFNKTTDSPFADIGTTITYTLIAKNTGTTAGNNIIITDTIPNGTAFVPGSVTVNGVPQLSDPSTGINIGSLGVSQISTITFKVVITALPSPNPIPNAATNTFTYTLDPSIPDGAAGTGNTNIVYTQVNHGEISNASGGFNKLADKDCAGINEIITYTILVKNTGNVTVNNVVIRDTIPDSTIFVPNSVTVNGTTFSGITPESGISINSLAAQKMATITFKVKVVTLPYSATTSNVALGSYTYTVHPTIPNGIAVTTVSNVIQTDINSAIIEGAGFTKSVDKLWADLGDTLIYTFVLTNSGNTNAFNVFIYDTIPNNTTFVPGSVLINGVPSLDNPQTGISIGTITPSTTVTVSYNITIDLMGIPIPNPIPNNGDVIFDFETCSGEIMTIRNSSSLI